MRRRRRAWEWALEGTEGLLDLATGCVRWGWDLTVAGTLACVVGGTLLALEAGEWAVRKLEGEG